MLIEDATASRAMQSPQRAMYYEYSPESFTGTEPEYAVEVCNAVIGVR